MRAFALPVEHAFRTLRRSPGFALAAVATLAAAIAVNVAMFNFLNAVFFRPFPYADIDRLHHVRVEARGSMAFRAPTVEQVREALSGLAEVGVYEERAFVLGGGPGTAAAGVQGTVLEPAVFALIGLPQIAGRLPDPADGISGAAPVVVLDEDLAISRFGGAAFAIGQTLRIDGTGHVVIGVLPARTGFPDFSRLWVPQRGAADLSFSGGLRMLGRLQPGVTRERVAERLERLQGGSGTATVIPFQPRAQGEVYLMLGAMVFLLLIACGNVANLVLARGSARRHELGVRAVLGASRSRLVALLIAEGLVLAMMAATLGGVGGAWLTDVVIALIPGDQLPLWFDPQVDARVLAWLAAATAMAVGIVSGVPAWTVTRGGLSTLLAESGGRSIGDGGAGRLRAGLVVAQIALAAMLLSGAGLLARSLVALRRADPGYAATQVLQLQTQRASQDPGGIRFVDDAVRSLNALPGVAGTAARHASPIAGRLRTSDGEAADAAFEAVTPSFFEVLGLPILRGRPFREGNAESNAVALISDALARSLFGTVDAAVGASVTVEATTGEHALTVIGVTAARTTLFDGGLLGGRPAAHVYVPASAVGGSTVELLMRGQGPDPLQLAAPAMETLVSLDADVVIRPPRTLAAVEQERSADLRWFTSIFTGFGVLALALAALGIYGVVSYTVGRRTREIGVRVALGATAPGVIALVLRGVLPSTALGLALGAAGSLGLGWLLRGAMFGVDPADPFALAAVLSFFLAVTLAAAWLPARRAAAIDPLLALRMD